MDSFEFNKIAAALLIALLTFKGADLLSDALVHPTLLKENAYKIEGVDVALTPGAPEGKKGPAPIEPLLAAANVKEGARIFKKCMSCHTAEKGGPNKIGPDLYDVVGAPKGKHPGYSYSSAMEKKGGKWTYDDLNEFLYNPRDYIPGTKMSFIGLKNDQERADVIAYLRQQNDNPPPLPEVKAKPEGKAEATKPSEPGNKTGAKPEEGTAAPAKKAESPAEGEKAEPPQDTTSKPDAPKPAPANQPEEKPDTASPAPAKGAAKKSEEPKEAAPEEKKE